MKKIAAIILLFAALGFVASSVYGYTYSNLVYHLAKYGCDGQSSYVKNGCYAYLEHRILHGKNAGAALDACKDQCQDWFDYNGNYVNRCSEGGRYLYGME